jgi:peptidoglycan hydrolase-like protein with peptidoglycan-binding domain
MIVKKESCMPRAISLHIGLNNVDPNAYGGWDGQLNGCVNDANGMKSIADSLGFQSTIFTNNQATSARVIEEIASAAQSLQAGDVLLLTYSGHGGQVDDVNSDEPDARDETWVLYDREVIDDELYALWSQFAPGVRILVFSDSCHSGTVLKMRMTEDTKTARRERRSRGRGYPIQSDLSKSRPTAQPTTSEMPYSRDTLAVMEAELARPYATETLPASPQTDSSWEDSPKALPLNIQREVNERDRVMYNTLQWIAGPARDADVSASLILISGCQDNQLSYDGNYYGQFTGTLLDVWDNGAFQGDYASFHREILNRMPPEQSPNYYIVGSANPAFEQQRPFTIQAPGDGGSPQTPTQPPPATTRPDLQYGDAGEHVRYLQQRLQAHGYPITVDSYFGQETQNAVINFQRMQGLAADGIVGRLTWNALEQSGMGGSTTPPTPSQPSPGSTTRPVLRRGDRGEDVVYLQNLLREHGYSLTADGIFGGLTESHVRSFQSRNGLTVDGIVGQNTWAALEAEI